MTALRGASDPQFGILFGGYSDQDEFFNTVTGPNTGTIDTTLGGIMPVAVDSTGSLKIANTIGHGMYLAMPDDETIQVTTSPNVHKASVVNGHQMYAMYTYDVGGASPAIGTPGGTPPSSAILVMGTDGTHSRALLTDTTGKLEVLVENFPATFAAPGAAIPANAELVGGSDGTDIQPIKTDSSGIVQVAVTSGGGGNPAAGPTGSPVPADADYLGARDGSGNLVGLAQASGPAGAVGLSTVDAWNSFVGTADGEGIGLPLGFYAVGGYENPTTSPIAHVLNFDSSGHLLVVSSGATSSGLPLLTDLEGRLRVIIEDTPDGEDIEPDWSLEPDSIDPDLNQAVQTPVATRPPNALQVISPSSGPLSLHGPQQAPLPTKELGFQGGTNTPPLGFYTLLNAVGGTVGAGVIPCRTVATQTARCVMVNVRCISTNTNFGSSVSVRVRNLSNGATTGWQCVGKLQSPNAANAISTATTYHNLPVNPGDVLYIDCGVPTSMGGIAVAATLLAEQQPVVLRPDGRGYPIGSLFAEGAFAGGGGIVSAPNTGFGIMVYAASFSASASSASASLIGQIAATSGALIANAVTGSMTWPNGLLLDQNTAITAASSTGNATVAVSYDIVPQ